MRRGIETSFRNLKHTPGLLHLHAKKVEFVLREIFAKLTMYNFCELITQSVVIRQAQKRIPIRLISLMQYIFADNSSLELSLHPFLKPCL